jgi:hypothetical protein
MPQQNKLRELAYCCSKIEYESFAFQQLKLLLRKIPGKPTFVREEEQGIVVTKAMYYD